MKAIITILAVTAVILLASCNNNTPASTATTTTTTEASSASPSATAQQPTEGTDRGRVLFQEKCMACHGMNGDAQSNNAANLPHSVLDSLSITQTIKNGRGTMPMFKDAIADTDIAHLAIYVKSLRK